MLVSGHHVGAHLDGHQHHILIQISINLGKTSLSISCVRKIVVTCNLGGVFTHLPTVFSPDFGLYLLNGFDFYFDLF